MQTSGQQVFINKDKVYPGESVRAEITIVSDAYFKYQLSEGMDFEFREGPNIIGHGTILKIVNTELQKTGI